MILKLLIISFFSFVVFLKSPLSRKPIPRYLQDESDYGLTRNEMLPPGVISKQEVRLEIDPITRLLTIKKSTINSVILPVIEHVYTIDIQDLLRFDDYIKNLRQHLITRLFGDLEVQLNTNKLDKSYLYYKNLKQIKENYVLQKGKIEEKVEYLKKITEFSMNFVQNATIADLSKVITQRDVDIDAYNKFILLQLLEKLDDEMGEFRRAVLEDLSEIFREYEQVNSGSNLSTYEVVNKDIEISFRLTIFEENQLTQRVNTISAICRKITDNKNYHHIAQISNQSERFSVFLIGIHSFLLVWIFWV